MPWPVGGTPTDHQSVQDVVAALRTPPPAHTHPVADITGTTSKRTISADYTLVATDASNLVLHTTSTTPVAITLPADTVSIAQETPIPWRQNGTGQITFTAGAGATVLSRGSAFKSAGQYAEGVVTKVAANTWVVSGDLTA